jgi:hypothetical protein
MNTKAHCCIHKSKLLDPKVSNPQKHTPFLISILILFSHPRLCVPNGRTPSWFPITLLIQLGLKP